MNRHAYRSFVAVGLILTLFSPLAFAKKAKGKPGEFAQITSVDTKAGTVTVAGSDGKDATTYSVMPVTTITLDSQPAKLTDLRKGMHVDISIVEGGKAVSKIDATTPAPPKKKSS